MRVVGCGIESGLQVLHEMRVAGLEMRFAGPEMRVAGPEMRVAGARYGSRSRNVGWVKKSR